MRVAHGIALGASAAQPRGGDELDLDRAVGERVQRARRELDLDAVGHYAVRRRNVEINMRRGLDVDIGDVGVVTRGARAVNEERIADDGLLR